MDSHELAKKLLEMPRCKVLVSVDLSTCENDASNRAFGDLCGLQCDSDEREVTLLFDNGKLNFIRKGEDHE